MNVKELKKYCNEKAGAGDIKILRDFMQRQKRKANETIICNAIVFLGLASALTLIISVCSGKFSFEIIKNMIPFYLFFAFFLAIITLGMTVKIKRISTRLKRAIKENESITVSNQNYLLYTVSTDHIAFNDGDIESSSFYHFSGEDDTSIHFNVGSRQTGCCFEEMESGEYYKLYCICEKNIFFVKSKSERV